MNNKPFELELEHIIFVWSLIGGFAFGLWQETISGGIFAVVALMALWRVE